VFSTIWNVYMVCGLVPQHQCLFGKNMRKRKLELICPRSWLAKLHTKYSFLASKAWKACFPQNLDAFFAKYPSTHLGNTLLVDDTPYESMFNESFNVIFVKMFDTCSKDPNDYLVSIVLPYLECLHNFGMSVSTFVKHNPFGSIRRITHGHHGPYKMLYQNCSHSCSSSYCKNA